MALHQQNIKTISDFLNIYTREHLSVKPKTIFDSIKYTIDIDFNQFKTALQYLIKSNTIEGYVILADGLIYSEEKAPDDGSVIKDSYSCFRLKSKNWRESSIPPISEIEVCSRKIKTNLINSDLYILLVNIFRLRENPDGEILLADKKYSCNNLDVLIRFLDKFCAVDEINQ